MATIAKQGKRERENESFSPLKKVSQDKDLERIVVDYNKLWTKEVARIHPNLSLSPEAEMVMQGIVDSLAQFFLRDIDGTFVSSLVLAP